MKNTLKIIPILALTCSLFCSLHVNGQTTSSKIGCISFTELLNVMPEFKRADTTLARFRDTLEQKFDALKTGYTEQASFLSSTDILPLVKKKLGL